MTDTGPGMTVLQLMWEYAERSGRKLSTVSRYCSGSGATAERMQKGGSVTGARLTRMRDWLKDNWQDDWPQPVWPEQIDLCESDLERDMLRQIREAGLPEPVQQCPMGRHRADFAWLEHKVIVEVKGQSWGVKRSAREAVKRNTVTMAGWNCLEFWPEHLKSGYAIGILTEVLAVKQGRSH